MKYILIILFVLFFTPITFEIYVETDNIREKKDYIKIKIFGIKIIKFEFSEKIDSIVDIESFIKIQMKIYLHILKYVSKRDVLKILKNLKYKKINILYGVHVSDYILNMFYNVSLTTGINVILGCNSKKLAKTEISIKNVETNYPYTYKINCIFKTNIANNIVVIANYIIKIIKERWNLKWQNIQLKA